MTWEKPASNNLQLGSLERSTFLFRSFSPNSLSDKTSLTRSGSQVEKLVDPLADRASVDNFLMSRSSTVTKKLSSLTMKSSTEFSLLLSEFRQLGSRSRLRMNGRKSGLKLNEF